MHNKCSPGKKITFFPFKVLSSKHKIEVRLYDASEREIKRPQERFQSLVPRKMTNCGCSHSVLRTISTSFSSLKLGTWEMEEVSSASEYPWILWALWSLSQDGGEAKTNNISHPLSKSSCFWICCHPFPSQRSQRVSLSLACTNLL